MLPRIFISYARADDEAFAKKLYDDLRKRGFEVWRDRESLHSIQIGFHQQIKDAIREDIDRLIFIAGPKSAVSEYVREEWLSALENDKPVIPILRLGDYNCIPGEVGLSSLHCDDFRDDSQYDVQFEKLIANLNRPEPPLGRLFAVPSLPPHFLGRPDILRKLKDAVQIDLQKPVVVTGSGSQVGLQGMGGIGKSVLAAAVARDREIRRSYPDGVIWISFKQQPDVVQLMRDVAKHLGDEGSFQTIAQGQGILRELLLNKAVLLVLDDVWKASDAKVFDIIGPRCRALITTRDAGILHTLHGEMFSVELFTKEEALQLLAESVEKTIDDLPQEAYEIVKECGCLPLAVALCGGMAKKRGGGWDNILYRLQHADLDKIEDRHSINEQHISIWKAMQISVEMLDTDKQNRFSELSAFVTDRRIPEAAIDTLWSYTGNLNNYDTEDLVQELFERSLIRVDKPDRKESREIYLHDLLYDYAVKTIKDPKVLQQNLLKAYENECTDGWHTGPNDGYYFQNLCHHFLSSDDLDKAVEVLTDLKWIASVCSAGLVYELISDYKYVMSALPEAKAELEEEKKHLERVHKYTDDIIAYATKWNEARKKHKEDSEKYPMPKDVDITFPEIIQSVEPWSDERRQKEIERIINNPTRLNNIRAYSQFVISESSALKTYGKHPGFVIQHAYNNAEYPPVLETAREEVRKDSKNVLLLQKFRKPVYDPFPALLNTLEGHTLSVDSVAITPDGNRAVSGSKDSTLRLWDLESGACLKVLEGHTSSVESIAITPDGKKAVSGSKDNTLRLWDLESGDCLKIFKGHTHWVKSITITSDGKRIISGSADDTLRLWDLECGKFLKVLEGHTSSINSVAITPEGKRAVSGSMDNTLRLWDLESGACLKVLEGHTTWVKSVVMTPDGKRAVSGSDDFTLRLWDLESGACLKILEGHTNVVTSVAITPNGKKVVSGSDDFTLRLWDLESGVCLKVLEGHTSEVKSVAIIPDGKRAVSGSKDNTLRLWDLKSGASLKVLEGQTHWVKCVAITPNGKMAITGGRDGTFRILDLESSNCLEVIEGHTSFVQSIVITPDEKKSVTGSSDSTLRLWDLESGACLKVLEGHTYLVSSVAITPDGKRAVSGSHDKTLCLWDLESGACLKVLKGHTSFVSSVAITPDGKRAVSGSNDSTLRLWNLESEKCLKILEGHISGINSIAITPDGKRVVSGSGDSTLRLWNLESGKCLKILEGHISGINSIAITPDGKMVVSGSEDRTLRLWDLESRVCISVLKTKSAVRRLAFSYSLNSIIAVEDTGQFHFIEAHNFHPNIFIITLQRLWFSSNSSKKGKWDENISALCLNCGKRFIVEEKYTFLINYISRKSILAPEQSPCLSLPDKSFEFPGLLSECPNCKITVRFNPFIADNKDNKFYNEQSNNIMCENILNIEQFESEAINLNNLACNYRMAGNFAAAEKYFRIALDYDTRARGDNHPKIAHRLNNLSVVFIRTGKFDEAKVCLERAWEIMNCEIDITGFRILFMRLCLAMLNDEPYDVYLGQIKTVMSAEGLADSAVVNIIWGIDDFIFYICNKLPEDKALMLQTIFNVHNGRQNLTGLNELSFWRKQNPESLGTKWNN